MIDGITMIAWAAIAQGFFLSMLYLFSRKHKSISNRVLAFFLVSLLLEAISVFRSGEPVGGYNVASYFAYPETLMFFPGLFFHYILLKIGRAQVYLRFIRVIYFCGFALWSLTLLNLLLFILNGETLETYFSEKMIEGVYMTQQYMAFLLTVFVIFLSIRELKQYARMVKSEHSDISLLNINWLWQFALTMIPVSILWGSELLRIMMGGLGTSDIATAAWGVLFIFIYFVSYKAFVQKDLFEVNVETPSQKIQPLITSPKLQNQLPEEDLIPILKDVEKLMQAERLFLQSDLTIHELAKRSNFPARKISQGINRKYDTNFSEWVNRYRVAEAQKQLGTFSESNLTIEGIGYDSGFKSRSAMYLAFKKITGKSPGDFKG